MQSEFHRLHPAGSSQDILLTAAETFTEFNGNRKMILTDIPVDWLVNHIYAVQCLKFCLLILNIETDLYTIQIK